ncbi:class I SAM-dependent methyltransferase [bacterium]|nr:class I SAM-dependent methyltransferase [bacterium]
MMQSTAQESYTQRLVTIEQAWWRKILDPQIPYRWFLKRQKPGFMLEVGCGIGRNLLNNCGRGVGLDHNPMSVSLACSRGLTAFTPGEFAESKFNQDSSYDSLLLAHVIEHMTLDQAQALVQQYLRYLKQDGKLILICPQKAGFRSDATLVEYFDLPKMQGLVEQLGMTVRNTSSFPFPSIAGDFFTYNEWVMVAGFSNG